MTGPRPTSRGVAAAVLGAVLTVAGLQWRYAGVLGLGVALLVLVTVALLSVVRPAAVRVRRTVRPLEVTRFEPCDATVRVRRRRAPWSVPVEVVDRIAGDPVPISLPRSDSDGAAEAQYAIPTVRRGVVTVGPLEVRRTALAGLARSAATVAETVAVRVLPRVLPVRGLPSGIRRGQAEADERAERGGTDLVALREYLPGDDLRRLHWATSARRGTLMVREDADPVTAHLTLLLDDRAASYPGDGFEDAVEVAASLAVAAARDGHPVRLLTVGGRWDRQIADVTALADVTAYEGEADPPTIPVPARDVVVVVTGRDADPGPLLAEAGRATAGIAMVVDEAGPPVAIAAPVTVLRGRDSVALLTRWDAVVVRS